MSKSLSLFLRGLSFGALLTFPVYLLAEHIRYGFISTWMPLWIVFLTPLFVSVGISEGERLSFLARMILFFEYSIVFSLLILRTVHTEGLLLAVLLVSAVFACYLVFSESWRT